MRTRVLQLWNLAIYSYWFVPALMTLGAIGLSLLTLWVDRGLGLERIRTLGPLADWIYTGGVDGAREVLSTIAGSMITVAGVVFSITIVALTLASSQFGPRVLSYFMRDRPNQVVLGTFLSTFIYCLLVLRTIRSEDGDLGAVVPHVSISVGVLLSLASIGVLIFFIHHVATAIQAPNLVARIAAELHETIDRFFPEGVETAGEEARESLATYAPEVFERESAAVPAPADGYVEAVDTDALVRRASGGGLLFRLEYRPGQFVVRGAPLVRVWPADLLDEETRRGILASVALGPRRTPVQDVEFAVNQLVQIAVRALSPGVNDPFTATNCIDRLSAALCHLMACRLPSPYHVDDRGETRLVVRRPFTVEGFADACFHQIRQNAGGQAAVHIRLQEALAEAARCARRTEHLRLVLRHAQLAVRSAREGISERDALETLERRHAALLEAARRTRDELPGDAAPADS